MVASRAAWGLKVIEHYYPNFDRSIAIPTSVRGHVHESGRNHTIEASL